MYNKDFIETELERLLKELIHYQDVLLKNKKTYPPGTIVVQQKSKKVVFHLVLKGNKRMRLPIESNIVGQYVQKEYEGTLLRLLNRWIPALRRFVHVFRTADLDEPFDSLNPLKKPYVTPLFRTRKEFVEHWKNANYPHKERTGSEKTLQGVMVRSRAERIIADFLFHNNIPFRYEETITIPDVGTMHPDFTILNPQTGQTFYYEHFGKMNDPDYVENVRKKLAGYASIGCIEGDGLLCDYEFNGKFDAPLAEFKIRRFILNQDETDPWDRPQFT